MNLQGKFGSLISSHFLKQLLALVLLWLRTWRPGIKKFRRVLDAWVNPPDLFDQTQIYLDPTNLIWVMMINPGPFFELCD